MIRALFVRKLATSVSSTLASVSSRLWAQARNVVRLVLTGKEANHPIACVTEVSTTEIAQHMPLAPNRAWRKVTRRWRRSLGRDPKSARILNNLGVAYEQQGLFQLADECYRKALDMAPENAYIQRNYELFMRARVNRHLRS